MPLPLVTKYKNFLVSFFRRLGLKVCEEKVKVQEKVGDSIPLLGFTWTLTEDGQQITLQPKRLEKLDRVREMLITESNGRSKFSRKTYDSFIGVANSCVGLLSPNSISRQVRALYGFYHDTLTAKQCGAENSLINVAIRRAVQAIRDMQPWKVNGESANCTPRLVYTDASFCDKSGTAVLGVVRRSSKGRVDAWTYTMDFKSWMCGDGKFRACGTTFGIAIMELLGVAMSAILLKRNNNDHKKVFSYIYVDSTWALADLVRGASSSKLHDKVLSILEPIYENRVYYSWIASKRNIADLPTRRKRFGALSRLADSFTTLKHEELKDLWTPYRRTPITIPFYFIMSA